MATPAYGGAAEAARLRAIHERPAGTRLSNEEIDALIASIPPLPRTPEEREAIPDYGDLASSIIWYPIYADPWEETTARVVCRNCPSAFESHDPDDGLCPSPW